MTALGSQGWRRGVDPGVAIKGSFGEPATLGGINERKKTWKKRDETKWLIISVALYFLNFSK